MIRLRSKYSGLYRLLSQPSPTYRTVVQPGTIVTSRLTTPANNRPFSSSLANQGAKNKTKKGGKGHSNDRNAGHSPPDPDIPQASDIIKEVKQIEARFQDCVEQFGIKSAETKHGKASAAKIGQSRVTLSSDEGVQGLKNIANIQIKNNSRTIVLTVFDPKHVKYINSAMLAELGVTPQVDPKNEQVITITLPTRTADVKKELAKQIKQEYEHFRNSHSKHSLTSIREDMMKHLKKCHSGGSISHDEFKDFNKDVERLFKKYSDELGSSFKKVEKSVLQD